MRVGGGGGFEADGEEHHLAVRMPPCQGYRVEGRVHDAHVAARGLDREQIARAARHAQHVAEGAEDDAGAGRDLQRLVNDLQRRHAHRAARPVHQRELRREQFVEAEFYDGVGLPAADLHQRPRAGDQSPQRGGQGADLAGIAVLVEVAHGPARPGESVGPFGDGRHGRAVHDVVG
jgi:hypothetical protein